MVNEGGDKEKLESFVNFCEDTIFEVTNTCVSTPLQSVLILAVIIARL